MKASPQLKRQFVVLLISLLASVLAAALPPWASINFRTSDQVMLGVLLFLVFISLDVYFLASALVSRERHEAEVWAVRSPVEQLLSSSRASFEKLIRSSYGKHDLFVTHFMSQLRDMDRRLRDVAEKGELRVLADHFLSVDNVLDVFKGDGERIWRYTWFIDPGEKLFGDLAWRRYFEKTAELLNQKSITEIRCLLVFSDLALVDAPRIQALFRYFASHRGFGCCYMTRSDYAAISADNQIPANWLDFGVYGNGLLFLTEHYTPDIVGTFSKDSSQIEHYTRLFDSLWGSRAVARKNPAAAKPVLTIEELFAADSVAAQQWEAS